MKNFFIGSLIVSAFIYGIIAVEEAIIPFFISAILAYIFHPLVKSMAEKLSLPKNLVITFIVFFVIFLVVGLTIVLIPIIYNQLELFISKIPLYKLYIQNHILPFLIEKTSYLGGDFIPKIDDAIHNLLTSVSTSASNIIGYTSSIAEVIITILLIPIILFYLLRDWPQNILENNKIISKNSISIARKFLNDIDILLSSYMRGQFKVCFIMALYYSICLTITGMDLALLMGFISGFSIILPFLGFCISSISTIILGYLSFGLSIHLLYIFIIYMVGAILEGSILTPKIIGNKIGLHPLWIIFSVLAMGNMFGVVGMLFAIPVAGIIKIILQTSVEIYTSSKVK